MKSTALTLVGTNNMDHGSVATPIPSIPNLSQDAFHGPLGEIVQELVCETPPAVLLALAHAATGLLFGPTPGIQVGATIHTPRLYLALIDQDRSRLRSAIDLILDVLLEADPAFTACVSDAFSDSTEKEKKNKKTDAGAEGQNDPRCLVILRGLDALRDEAEEVARTFYPPSPSNQSSDAQAAVIATLGRLPLLDCDVLDAFARDYGHFFMWILSSRAAAVPRLLRLDDDSKAEFSRLAQEVKAYAKTMEGIGFNRLSFDAEAADLWAHIYPTLTAPTPGLLGLVMRYAPVHVLRLTLNYAHCDCAATISATHLRAAYAFWQFSGACAGKIFANRGIDDLQNRILAHLQTGEGRLTKSELSKRLSHHQQSHKLDSALLALQHAGLVCLERRHTGGRSATDISLNIAHQNTRRKN